MSDDMMAVIETAVAGLHDESPETDTSEQSATTETSSTPAPDAADDTEIAAETKEVAAPEVSEEAELATLEKELVEKTPGLRKGAVPSSRHQAVVTRVRNQYEAQLAEANKKLESYKPYDDPHTHNRLTAARMAEESPENFTKVLQGIPAYQAIFNRMIDEAVAARAPKPSEKADDLGSVAADILLEDGSSGFTTANAQKLVAHAVAQAKRDLQKELDAVRGEIKPIQDERRDNALRGQAAQRASTTLSEARKEWPGFKDHESAIRAVLEENTKAWELNPQQTKLITLDQAYRQVVVPRFQTDKEKLRAEIRAELVKEQNERARAPKSIRPGLPAATADDDGAPQDMESIIRGAISTLPR